MTVVREYANLAPLRYQHLATKFTWLLAVVVSIVIVAHYLFGMPGPLLECGESLLFMAVGINWFIWPNAPVSNPLATRLLGVLLFVVGLWMLIDVASHHLI